MYIKLSVVKKRINQPLTVWLKNEFFKIVNTFDKPNPIVIERVNK